MEISKIIRQGIEAEFFRRGGTTEQWEKVRVDPRKFNLVWNRVLGLSDSTLPPPPEWRTVDPRTREILGRVA